MLRSKALISTEELGNQYVLCGPYKEQIARQEVEDLEFPHDSPLQKAVTFMRNLGFKVLVNQEKKLKVDEPLKYCSFKIFITRQ